MTHLRTIPVAGVALLILVGIAIGALWWRAQPLGKVTLSDGTEVVFERFTYGTKHEFGGRDLGRIKWIPARLLNLIGYKTPVRYSYETIQARAILWARVRRTPEPAGRESFILRSDPLNETLHPFYLQAMEADGTAYAWKSESVKRIASNEILLLFGTVSLPPHGARLRFRFVEKNGENLLADGGRIPAHTVSATVSVPNPDRVVRADVTPQPLPQTQVLHGLQATVTGFRITPRYDDEFFVEPEVEFLWNGDPAPDGLRHWWSIGAASGPMVEPESRPSPSIDQIPETPMEPSQLPRPPMRGHSAWILRLTATTTAAFPGLASEEGSPLTREPVPADWSKQAWPPKPEASAEAAGMGLTKVEVMRDGALRISAYQTPAHLFPAGWRRGDLPPFLLFAQSGGKRVQVSCHASSFGFGSREVAFFDYGDKNVVYQLAYGEDWRKTIKDVPPYIREPLPETIEYRLMRRSYWTFDFVVVPPLPR